MGRLYVDIFCIFSQKHHEQEKITLKKHFWLEGYFIIYMNGYLWWNFCKFGLCIAISSENVYISLACYFPDTGRHGRDELFFLINVFPRDAWWEFRDKISLSTRESKNINLENIIHKGKQIKILKMYKESWFKDSYPSSRQNFKLLKDERKNDKNTTILFCIPWIKPVAASSIIFGISSLFRISKILTTKS